MRTTAFLIFFLCQSICYAQVSGNANYSATQFTSSTASARQATGVISLTVSGLANIEAEEYVAIFTVTQLGETAEKTDALMNDRIRHFKNGVSASGIDTALVHTDLVSFVPKFDIRVAHRTFSRSYNEVPDGYELQKNILVRYRHSKDLDKIISAAARSEIYDLARVDYFITDIKKHYADLRKKCLETLHERMKDYELIGIRLDTMKKVIAEDFATVLPFNRYNQYTAASRPSYGSQKADASSFPLKINPAEVSASRYYSAVQYDKFDVVVNPVIDRPMVQLTFQLTITMVQSKPERQIMLLQNGVLTRLE